MFRRKAVLNRETKETTVKVELDIDGSGQYEIMTGNRMLDHLLNQLAYHGVFDIKISANGTDLHHVVEDVAISLGKAFNQALGEKRGITRMGYAFVPMDDSLAMVAVDISGRGYAVIETPFSDNVVGDLPADLIRHFLISFAAETKFNLHAKIISGINNHHQAEALFKALARALDTATIIDERVKDRIPSTKNIIEN